MRTLILTAAVLIAGLAMCDKANAEHQYTNTKLGPSHAATVTLAAHHGHSRYGYAPHRGYSPYRHYEPSYHHGYGCHPPVIVRPPVVVPYPYYPYGYYGGYGGYGYYRGGVSVNTGRVGFSFSF